MEERRVRGLVDIIKVSKPEEIRELTRSHQVDRQFTALWPLMNGLLLRKVLAALSHRGQRFPTMRPKGDALRAQDQAELWERLNARAAAAKLGPEDLRSLAKWVNGPGDEQALGPLVQQAVGRLFVDSYVADSESWNAALILGAAPRPMSIIKFLSWGIMRKVSRAQTLLGTKVGGDLVGIHGTGIALHNIVKGFLQMHSLYSNITQRSTLTPEEAASQCLFAPASVMRQATSDGEIAGCPFHKNALFILELSEAHKQANTNDLVFLDQSWSRCPADQWVPALFEGVWRLALAHDEWG